MKKLLFSIRDSKAESFSPLAEFGTRMEAIRSLSDTMRDEESPFAKYAEDFSLFEVGSFDHATGWIEVHVQPICVVHAYELRAPSTLQVAK